MRRALLPALASLCLATTAGCGAAEPAALPHDADFRSCLTATGTSAGALDSYDARRSAFAKPGPWSCVLGLASDADRHRVLGGVFPADASSLLTAMTGWIATRKGDGREIATDVGTLMAAADDPLPDDAAKASLRHDLDDQFQSVVSLAIYQHCDGELPGYDAYLARPDLKGNPSAPNRYYQDLMDQGGAVADRLRGYAATIDRLRDTLREK